MAMPADIRRKIEIDANIKLGKLLKYGNGYIFEIKKQPYKLIKIVNVEGAIAGCLPDVEKVTQGLEVIKNKQNKGVVRIYKTGYIDNTWFYYVMQKLREGNY